jgi:enoyl-CoA hydratase
MEFVRLDVEDGVAVVRLDRPPANAVNRQLALELQVAILEAEERRDVGAIVLWGGRRIFAAGADVKEIAELEPDEVRPSVDALGDACDLLERISKVAIAAICGYALGGGLELALGCDLRYVSADAKIGQPEIKIGVMPGAGGTQRLTRLVGPGRARDLVYTGRVVEAEEAVALGLAERIVDVGDVLDVAIADAHAFAHGPREALAAAKRSIHAAVETPGQSGIREERERFVALFGGYDQREGMRAFLEKRSARFGGPAV